MIIEIDKYKKQVAGYDPEKSEDVHRESACLADVAFQNALKQNKFEEVIFMAGGAASGKTEYAHTFLTVENLLVYDGTLKKIEGLEIKCRNIKKIYKDREVLIKVILIIPDSIEKSFSAFLGRERKIPIDVFFET